MIRRAFKNGWTIDAAVRAEIVAELRRAEQSGEGSAYHRKAIVATLRVAGQ